MSDNKNIEKFIKKRLETNDFPFNEDHWKQLEAKLDAEEKALIVPSSKGRITKTMLIVAGAVALFFAGWFANNLRTEENISLQKPAEEVTSAKVNTAERNESTVSELAQEKTPVDSKQKIEVVTKESSEKASERGEQIAVKTEVASQQQKSIVTENQTVANTNNKPIEKSTTDENRLHNLARSTERQQRLIYSDTSRVPLSSMSRIELGQIFISPYALVDSTEKEQKQKERQFSYTANLFVAPDFNATSFSQLFNKIGEMVGLDLQIEYKNKFKFGVGAIYNNKNYMAFGREYSPPKGFWTNGIVPDNTEAECEAIDIPISVGCKIINLPKQRFWVNAGVSSYWLLKENYSFIYNNPDPDLVQGWSGQNENFHFFGSLNVSLMYEQSLLNNLSLTVEPYYKTPLKGIGHGSVDLISGGVKVGLLYRFKPPPRPRE